MKLYLCTAKNINWKCMPTVTNVCLHFQNRTLVIRPDAFISTRKYLHAHSQRLLKRNWELRMQQYDIHKNLFFIIVKSHRLIQNMWKSFIPQNILDKMSYGRCSIWILESWGEQIISVQQQIKVLTVRNYFVKKGQRPSLLCVHKRWF